MHFYFVEWSNYIKDLKNKEDSPTAIRQNFRVFMNTLQFCNFSITFIMTGKAVNEKNMSESISNYLPLKDKFVEKLKTT